MTKRVPSLLALAGLWIAAAHAGCASAPRNESAVRAYFDYDFTTSREALRADAELGLDEQAVLINLRLGMASMADGDVNETERAFERVFDYLSTAGLNQDRTTAAAIFHEGVRIWKGEPFEQALAYHEIAASYAIRGDWENMRAAAINSLFRLTDFGKDQDRELDGEDLARREAERPGYLDTGYTAVDSDFALGFLMEGIGADLSGLGGAEAQFDAAIEIIPGLEPIVRRLRERDYDTLLIVDWGKGPTKIAYGPDDALARFDERDRAGNLLHVAFAGRQIGRFSAVCDVNEMSRDHRWNNLEDVRKAKSAIGDVLIGGGAISLGVGAHNDSDEAQIAGAAAILAGILLKSGARADTRHLEFAPAEVFLVPVRLGERGDLVVAVEGEHRSAIALPDFEPGEPGNPRALYLRLHGPDSPQPHWLVERDLQHGNDHDGVLSGDAPWILGGTDVSTPSRQSLERYQASGFLHALTPTDLEDLYRAEDILIGSGMENRPDARKNPSFRHVLEGGTGLFTPLPYSMGYKRLMYSTHPAHRPRSSVAARLADEIRSDHAND